MSKAKDTNYWQNYEANRKAEAGQNQKARGKSLDKEMPSSVTSNTELLKQQQNQLKNDKKELNAEKKHDQKVKAEKVKLIKVKSAIDPNHKVIKVPSKQPEFNHSVWKKNQEERQKAIDAKVNKDEVKSKPSLQSKIQKFFIKAESKVKEAPKSEKPEQPQKTEKKNLAQKLKQDFKPIKKETPVKSKPIKKPPTKGK